MNRKKIFLGILIFWVPISFLCVSSGISYSAEKEKVAPRLISPTQQPTQQPTEPRSPPSPSEKMFQPSPAQKEKPKEVKDVTGSLSINRISPEVIFTDTRQITVSYNLSLSSPSNVSTIPVKISLFLDNQSKQTQEINFPNGRTLRLFISCPPPEKAGDYTLTLKAAPKEVPPMRRDLLYATATQRIKVEEPVQIKGERVGWKGVSGPDLIIESFTVSDPIMKTTDRERFEVEYPVSIRVKNIGNVDAGPFDVAVREDVVEGGGLVFKESLSGLRAGQSIDIGGRTRGINPIREGLPIPEALRFQAKADEPLWSEFASREGQVKELNEDNNLSEVVEKGFGTFIPIRAPAACYRGSHIEITGNFGSSFGNKRVVLEYGGSAELINFSPNRITVKIPKNIAPDRDDRLFIKDESGRRISNYQAIHIIKPVRINWVRSRAPFTYSPSPIGMPFGTLINGYHVEVNYDWRGTGILKWAIVSSLPARDGDFRMLGELEHNIINLLAGSYYFVMRDFTEPYHATGESEGIAIWEVTVKNVERGEINLTLSMALRIDVYLDYHGSWIELAISSNGEYRERKDLPPELTDFVMEGPAGIRDIRHKIQDMTGWLGYPRRRSAWGVYNGKMEIPITFETGGPIEIKRYAKGLLGNWNDDLAYDINLTEFNLIVRFGVGSRGYPLTAGNIIHSVEVDVNLSADISNVPDWMEVWDRVDRRISNDLKSVFTSFFTSDFIRNEFYKGLMEQIKQDNDLKDLLILNAYISGNNFVVEYITL